MSVSLWDIALATLTEEQKQGIDLRVGDRRTILDDLAAAVREKKDQCIAGRIKFKRRNGDVVVLHDIFVKIARWLDKFKQIGDIAVQYDPGHASLPWAAVRFLIQCSVNGIQMQEQKFEGLEIACKIIARYAVIESLYSQQISSASSMLQEAITSTYASILIFLSTSLQQFQHSVARRLLRGVVPSSWVDEFIQDIEEKDRKVTNITSLITSERVQLIRDNQIAAQDTVEHLDTHLQELQISLVDQTNSLKELIQSFQEPLVRTIEDIATIQLRQSDRASTDSHRAERKEILRWLSTVPYKSHHQAISEKILNGTGSWLLEHPQFRKWTDSSTTSLLWLHGIQAQRADPAEVVLALLKQIVCSRKDWQENSEAAKTYRDLRDRSEEDGTETTRLNIRRAASLLKAESERTPMIVLVDAFDECLPNERYELIRIFKVIMEDANMIIKIMISSRDDLDIGSNFRGWPDIPIQMRNTRDIHHFVRIEIQNAIDEKRILNGRLSQQLHARMVKILGEKSQGMFLWASLQISSLCDCRRLKTERDLENELLRLPQSLTEIYQNIIESIQALRENGRAIAEAIFQWLLYSLDFSISSTLSYCAIASNTGQDVSLEEALDLCANLVVHDTVTGRLRLAHLSVQEFLQTRSEYNSKHTNMVILQTLIHAYKYSHCALPRVVPSNFTKLHSDEPSAPRLSYIHCNWSFLYLRRTWSHHYASISETDRQIIFESGVKQFIFKERLLNVKLKEWKLFTEGFIPIQQIPQRFRNALNDKYVTGFAKVRIQDLSEDFFDFILHAVLWSNINFEHIKLACIQGWQEVLDEVETIMPPAFSHLGALHIARSFLSQDFISKHTLFHFDTYKWKAQNKCLNIKQQYIGGISLSLKSDMIPLIRLIQYESYIGNTIYGLTAQASSQRIQNWGLADGWEHFAQQLTINKTYDNLGKVNLLLLAVACEAPIDLICLMLSKGADPHLGSRLFNCETPFLASIRLSQQFLSRELLSWTSYNSDPALFDGRYLLQYAIDKKCYYTAGTIVLYGLSTVFSSEEIRTEWMSLLNVISFNQRPAAAGMELERREICIGPMIPHFGSILPSDAISETLLCTAAQLRHDRAINLLLQMGVNPACPSIPPEGRKAQNNDTESDFHHQSQAEKSDKKLNKAHLELKQAPLAWAAATGNLYLIRKILDQGVSPNLPDSRNQTPMFSAVEWNKSRHAGGDIESAKLEIVQLLHSRGADPAWIDNDGKTASWYALRSGFPRIAKWLIDACPKPSGLTSHAAGSRLWDVFDGGEERIAQSLLAKTKAYTTSTSGSSSSRDSNTALVARLINSGVGRLLAEQSQEMHEGGASKE